MAFFEEDKPVKGKGYKGGSDKNLSDIDKYVRPLIEDAGIVMKLNKLDGTSNRQKLFLKKGPSKVLQVQVIVVSDLHSIDSRANSNIPEETVDNTLEDDRIHTHLVNLSKDKVYLLLYVKRGGWYCLFRYDSIPEEHYQLTYRARPDRKNRIWIPAEYLPKFKQERHLAKELQNLLFLE